MRSVSTTKYADSTGVSAMVARTMIPVSPMPPTVAQNSSSSGVRVVIEPSAVTRSRARRWSPKLPAVWWFLPWMSLAMAPPMVT